MNVRQIKVKIFCIYLVMVSVLCVAQNQANIWKCGANMGLNFNTTPPTPIAGQTNNVDNTTSISDASGALLFYSNGSTVWNKNNVIMPNGTGLTSFFSAGQCALIVPIPSSSKYVIFCNTEFASPGQLHYTVVDMSLNAGLGDVVITQKNISLGTGWTEKACAIYNSNCNYYWVLMHKWSNNQFVAVKVDASGVTTNSVTTSIGSIHNCGSYSAAHDAMGQLTISKDGQKVVNALTCQDKFDLFDFNINTGVLSNFISIPGNGGNAWGTGFSQDSKKLYVNSIFGQDVFQYDLSTYTSAAIISSKISLYTTGVGGYNFGYMELGPDNKMYIPRPSTNYFSVINSPNNLGAASGFSFSGLNVSPYSTTHGISRIAYNIGPSSSSNSGTISSTSSNSNVMCFGASTASASVFASTPGTYTYLWSPGNYTTASVSNLSAGIYTVSISDGACSTTTTSIAITQPSALTSSLTSTSYSVCKNQTVTLNSIFSGGTPSYSINWNNGSTNTVSVAVSPSVTTVYSYTVTDANLCTKAQTVSILVQSPIANFSVTSIPCSGIATFTNSSSGSNTYNWIFGNGSTSSSSNPSTQTYTSSGTYTVQLNSFSSLGCVDSIKKTITIITPSIVPTSYASSPILCYGGLSSATVSPVGIGPFTYTWSSLSNTTSVVPNLQAGTYTVNIVSASCESASLVVNITQPAQLNTSLTATSYSICKNQSITLNSIVSGGAPSYSVNWNNGSTNTASVVVSPSVASVYSYTVSDANLCTKTQTVSILVQSPIANFSVTSAPCSGISTFANLSSSSSTYNWIFGNGSTSSSSNPGIQTFTSSGTYTVQLNSFSSLGCADSIRKTITITTPSIVPTSYVSSPILCYGGLSSATVSPIGIGPFTYTWSSLSNTTSVVPNLQVGTYTVNVVSPSCESASLIVNITQPAQLNATLTATSYSVCENSSTTLTAVNTGGIPTYFVNWNTGVMNTNSITITPLVTSIYSYTVTDANSCTKTQSVQIIVESTSASFINSTPSCNSLISFTNTSTNNATSIWDFGDGQASNSNTVTTNNYTASGIYTVSLVSFSSNGCKDTIAHLVHVNANFLNLNFDYTLKIDKCKDSLFLMNNSVGGTSYFWNFGDGNVSTQISPSHMYSSGVFEITLVGSNANCSDTITKEITIDDSNNSSNENTPNVFTPNGDGANDIFDFRVMSKCEGFIFEIFDRWGLSIYKMNAEKQSYWDGRTTSGKEVTDGTYFYIMNIESGSKIKGTVNVFR